MSAAFRGALLAAVLLLCGAARSVFAAPPQLETVEQIHARARAAHQAKLAAIEAAKRNPILEAITEYRTGARALAEYSTLVEVIKDDKNEKVKDYRLAAVDALVERFQREGTADPAKDKLRTQIGLELVELMRASTRDAIGLQCIQTLLDRWWPLKAKQFGFSKDDRFADRQRAYKKMKQALERGD